ncbi:MAG: hypothetical protein MUP55_02400, partial [Candidatus Aenigmarchaeota archaeon]|nr:hypothetical protein [Candidatus Aenigmarchaeota archaeon]
MEMCMESNQHMLDIGQCNGREQSCFQTMVSCVNFQDIQSWISQLSTTIQNGNNALAGMNTALTNAATQVGTLGVYGNYNAVVYATCGSGMGTAQSCCSETQGLSGTTISCNSQNSLLHVQTTNSNCNYPVITNAYGSQNNKEIFICQGNACNNMNLDDPSLSPGSIIQYQFKLYCFQNQNSFTSNVGNIPLVSRTVFDASKISSYYVQSQWTFTYGRGTGSGGNPRCSCPNINSGTTSGTGGITGDSSTQPPSITISSSQCSQLSPCQFAGNPITVTFSISAYAIGTNQLKQIKYDCKNGEGEKEVPSSSISPSGLTSTTVQCTYTNVVNDIVKFTAIDNNNRDNVDSYTIVITSP